MSLNLPLNIPHPPFFSRKPIEHEIHPNPNGTFDDTYTLNTQSSSQWDGFRRLADPKTNYFYNGVIPEDILNVGDDDQSEEEGEKPRKLGIDAWAKHGIVGRGVLLDMFRWAAEQGRPYDPFTTHPITASDLQGCAKAHNITFKTGDILLVRTGWLQTYYSLPDSSKVDRAKWDMMEHHYAGLEASEEMKDFLHDNYFAAAAADNANFEAWPPPSFEGSLHAVMLPLWGMPLGELWDLEALSEKCQELGRWMFLVTSAPSNVPGGVGSPPNALAIF